MSVPILREMTPLGRIVLIMTLVVSAAAIVMEWIAPEGLFAYTSVIHALVVAYTVFRMARRGPPVRDARDTFKGLPVPKTVTPESATLDPRADDPGASHEAAPTRQ